MVSLLALMVVANATAHSPHVSALGLVAVLTCKDEVFHVGFVAAKGEGYVVVNMALDLLALP